MREQRCQRLIIANELVRYRSDLLRLLKNYSSRFPTTSRMIRARRLQGRGLRTQANMLRRREEDIRTRWPLLTTKMTPLILAQWHLSFSNPPSHHQQLPSLPTYYSPPPCTFFNDAWMLGSSLCPRCGLVAWPCCCFG
jgi:hypothetical protein